MTAVNRRLVRYMQPAGTPLRLPASGLRGSKLRPDLADQLRSLGEPHRLVEGEDDRPIHLDVVHAVGPGNEAEVREFLTEFFQNRIRVLDRLRLIATWSAESDCDFCHGGGLVGRLIKTWAIGRTDRQDGAPRFRNSTRVVNRLSLDLEAQSNRTVSQTPPEGPCCSPSNYSSEYPRVLKMAHSGPFLTSFQLGYIAGLIDGEGSVGALWSKDHGFRAYLEVSNTHLQTLQVIELWLAAGHITVDRRNKRPVYHLRVTNYRDLYRVASVFKDHCRIKKRHLTLMTRLMFLRLRRFYWSPKRRNVNFNSSNGELRLVHELRRLNGKSPPLVEASKYHVAARSSTAFQLHAADVARRNEARARATERERRLKRRRDLPGRASQRRRSRGRS